MARSDDAAFLVLAILAAALMCAPAAAELTRVNHPPKSDGTLSLLVVGDWGRNGKYNQTRVAEQMGEVGEKLNIDFVISTGDNFYEDGLDHFFDPQFQLSFSDVYTARSLQKPWYLVLGNHDYRGDVTAQISPFRRLMESRFICMRSFIVNSDFVDFFFVDTTPFHNDYWNHPGSHKYDWRDVKPQRQYIDNLLKDLDRALKGSTARWKIVVGHHTMRSVGEHGDTKELVELLLPVLQNNRVDFYINGHDHCLEHIRDKHSPIQFFTSGGGSKAWSGMKDHRRRELEFYYDGQGFMSLQLNQHQAYFAFYNVHGKILYRWSSSKINHLQPTTSSYASE